MWPSLRDFLRVPIELTGKNVRIAVIDGEFPNHPDISTNERRTSYLITRIKSRNQVISKPPRAVQRYERLNRYRSAPYKLFVCWFSH